MGISFLSTFLTISPGLVEEVALRDGHNEVVNGLSEIPRETVVAGLLSH
jgi:hypothetical protein